MTRKLAWEKWYDEVQDEQLTFEDPAAEGGFAGEGGLDDSAESQQQGFSPDMFFMPKKVNTPFGIYEASDPLCPTNLFDCWIGHSNFPICQNEYKILIDHISGIGAFKVISKFRFFIGIEKLFNFSEVRREIEYKICYLDDDVLNFGVYK